MFDALTELISGSAWTYGLLLGLSALDVIFPVVPSETAVILGGVLAGSGDLLIGLVLGSAAVGAFLGDNIAYWIGRTVGERLIARLFKGDRHKRIEWAEQQIKQRGGYLIIVGRFIPGGRTAVTLAAGTLQMRWSRFIFYDVIAALFWASYASLLGFFGGKAFEEDPWKGFVLAFGIASAIAAGVEGYRWLKRRRELAAS